MSVKEATREDFWDLIDVGTVLVDVWSEQCQPCVKLAPHLEQLAEEYAELTVVKLEAPKARRVCMELKVMGLPTLLLFRDGEEVDRITDPDLDARAVRSWLNEHFEQ
ncbi:MAG TPA: thioredoxin family protein [Egibacteraceae bacterium]|jgi:thioredoxin-like negative regulator of GroEL|nr:thioredoxin family protein [Egibacteraceae bacterium]